MLLLLGRQANADQRASEQRRTCAPLYMGSNHGSRILAQTDGLLWQADVDMQHIR